MALRKDRTELRASTARKKIRAAARRERLLSAERLEPRMLLALSPEFLGDLNTGPAGILVRSPLVEMGGVAYFSGGYGLGDYELWKTDGTTAGTVLVKDIVAGVSGSRPKNLFTSNGTLFFAATNGNDGEELWKSDGTAAGTVMVKDIATGIHSSSPTLFTEMNGKLYFTAFDFDAGTELWRTDGTTAGTVRVRDIVPGFFSPSISELVNFNGTLFFNAREAIFEENDGMQLWKSDGTEAGTVKVTSVTGGIFGLNPEQMTKVGSTLYFTATDGSLGTELWKSDGTAAGTAMVADLATGVFSSFMSYLTNLNGTLIFRSNGPQGTVLYKTDGTAAGTGPVKSGSPSALLPINVANVGGTLYFAATDGTSGLELWKSDGTSAGTVPLKDITAGSPSSSPGNFTRHGGSVFFTANVVSGFAELWQTDGTAEGTVLVSSATPASSATSMRYLTSAGGNLLFATNDGVNGQELWRSRGTAPTTQKVSRDATSTAASGVAEVTVVESTAFFTAFDVDHGRELWKTNGKAAGTSRLELVAGATDAQLSGLTNLNGTLVFSANMGGTGSELWKSDGTVAGTAQIRDIFNGASSSAPKYLTNVGGVLYFAANDGTNGFELWRTDGTLAGTTLVKDIRSGTSGSDPKLLTNVNGRLYFVANDGTNGSELWTSDGSATGTILLKNIATGSASATLSQMTAVGNSLFFVANDGTNGHQLWKSNGTPAGTVLVRSVSVTTGTTPTPAALVNVSGTLFFAANDGFSGVELWKSDGSTAGTVRVKDIRSGNYGSTPENLVNVNGTLYFRANDGTNGTELWKSDGTAVGTVLFKETMSGASSGGPGDLANIRGTLLFTASVNTGREMWISDGTAAGSIPIADLAPGALSSSPRNIVAVGRHVLFTADDGARGRELWSLSEPNVAPSGGNRTAAVREDVPYTLSAADFGFSDAGNVIADGLLGVWAGSVPSVGSLTLAASAVTVGQFITAADIAAGLVVYTPPANASGNGLDALVFQVQDDGGTADSGIDLDASPNTLSMDVAPVNDAPSGEDRTVTVFDHVPYTLTAADFGYSDSDNPSNPLAFLKVVTLPAKGLLTAGGVSVTAGAQVAINAPIVFTPLDTDYSSQTPYASFTFQVKDSGGTANGGVDTDPLANTLTLNLAGSSTAPSGSDKAVTTLEDTPYTFAANDFTFSDLGDTPSHQFIGFRLSSLPTKGNLSLHGDALAAGDFVAAGDISQLVYTPLTNANGTAYAKFTFQVQDNGGTADGGVDLDSTPNTITIDVTPVNDAPQAAGKTIPIFEDNPFTFVAGDFGFSDPADAMPLNPFPHTLASVLVTAPLPFSGTIRLGEAFLVPGSITVVSVSQLSSLVFAPPPNLNSENSFPAPSISFRVQDNGGTFNGGQNTSQPATLTFNITSVNDPPRGFGGFNVFEDAPYTLSVRDFNFSDLNDLPFEDAFVAVRVESLPVRGSLFNGITPVPPFSLISVEAINNGLLRYIPNANANGVPGDTFTFRVQDDGGTAAGGVNVDPVSRTMQISIFSINDAPLGTDKIINPSHSTLLEENGLYAFTVADFGFVDPNDNPPNEFLAVKIVSLPQRGELRLAGDPVTHVGQVIPRGSLSSLTFVPAPGEAGTAYASFTFQVQDDGGTAAGGMDLDQTPSTITLNVLGKNDAPQGALGAAGVSVSTNEDISYMFSAASFGFLDAADSPSNTLFAVKIESIPLMGTLQEGTTVLANGAVVTRASIETGQLRFIPQPNQSGVSPAYASFTFRVQDDGGTANGGKDLDVTPRTMSIQVAPLNDDPVATPETLSVREDGQLVFTGAQLVANDSDADGDILRAAVFEPANGRTSHGTLSSVHGPGIGVSSFTYRPDPDFNGTDTIRYQAFDGTAASAIVTLTIQVTPVNDPPSCQVQPVPPATDESGLISVAHWIVCSPGPADEADQTVMLVLQSNSNSDLFATQPTIVNGTLSFTPMPNSSGSSQITFEATDNGGQENGGDDGALGAAFTLTVTKPYVLHNVVKTQDVTGDGQIVAGDALDVINYINAFRPGPVPSVKGTLNYLDTDRDNFISANDALEVINYVNAFGADRAPETSLAAEGEGATAEDSAADWLGLLAMDQAALSKRKR